MGKNFNIERKLKTIQELLDELNFNSENEKWKIKFLTLKLNKVNGLVQEIPLVQLLKKSIDSKNIDKFKTVYCVDTLDQAIGYLEFLCDYKKDY
jgi:hypothetical protein